MADEQQPSEAIERYEKQVSNAPSVITQPTTAPVQTAPQPKQPATQNAPTPQPAQAAKPQHTGPGWKQKLAERWTKLKEFYAECIRVLKVTKKPNRQELTTVVKVSGLGILLIGLIGFLIHLAKELLF